MSTIFVGNLSWNTQSEQLFSVLSTLGDLVHAVVVMDHGALPRSKGFGFATFSSLEDAEMAVRMGDGVIEIDGRKLRLEMARTRKKVSGGTVKGAYGTSLISQPAPLVSIETIEVVGEASDLDAVGDPPDDIAIAQVNRVRIFFLEVRKEFACTFFFWGVGGLSRYRRERKVGRYFPLWRKKISVYLFFLKTLVLWEKIPSPIDRKVTPPLSTRF